VEKTKKREIYTDLVTAKRRKKGSNLFWVAFKRESSVFRITPFRWGGRGRGKKERKKKSGDDHLAYALNFIEPAIQLKQRLSFPSCPQKREPEQRVYNHVRRKKEKE